MRATYAAELACSEQGEAHRQVGRPCRATLAVQVSTRLIVQLDKAALNEEVKPLAARQAALLRDCLACTQWHKQSCEAWGMAAGQGVDGLYRIELCPTL